MKYIYILKTGETFETTKNKFGDFDKWIINVIKNKNVKIIDILNNEKLPNIYSAKGFIITGSHAMVTQELTWSLELESYIKKIASKNIPVLGICYGHQLIAKALGGISGYNKNGKEIGTTRKKKLHTSKNDPILKNIPLQFNAHETHYQSVLKLPHKAIILANNRHESHQAVRFKKYVWGVQFHPEFDTRIMKEYIINQEKDLIKLNFNIKHLLKNVKKATKSSTVLNNFIEFIVKKPKKF